jgi:hypothetical protein
MKRSASEEPVIAVPFANDPLRNTRETEYGSPWRSVFAAASAAARTSMPRPYCKGVMPGEDRRRYWSAAATFSVIGD